MTTGSGNVALEDSRLKASSLTQRVMTAVVAVPVLAVLIWLGFWPVAILVVAATLLSLAELYRTLARGGYAPRRATGFACGLLFCAAALLLPLRGIDLVGLALTLAIIGSLVAELAQRDRTAGLVSWALTLAGTVYVAWLFSHYILLAAITTPLQGNGWLAALHILPGAAWIYTVLAITWLQDTGAYFAGRSFGRHAMAPYISPKKTWEGAAGGLLAAVLTALLCKPLFGLNIGYAGMALLGAVGAICGLVGDLAESFIKRQVNVKDAGQLLPGHGGILDRVDSMLFTGPVLYYLIRLLAG